MYGWMGAVLGSKNLKAIAVRGTGRVEVAAAEEFGRLAQEDRAYFRENKTGNNQEA